MKTLKNVVSRDEKAAKIVGLFINALIILIGGLTVIYGIITWAQNHTKFTWGLFTFVMSLTAMVQIFQTVKF